MRRRVGPREAYQMAGYDEFEVDIPAVFREQLPTFIDAVSRAALTLANVAALPDSAQGAYVLYYQGRRVYVGKTDAEAGFQTRLKRHFYNIQHRLGLDPADVEFRAVRIMVFHNFDVEAILMQEFERIDGQPLAWNKSGFGSNDPGHRREGQKPADFDIQYPVDISLPLPFVALGPHAVRDLLISLKDQLPYLLRYETDLLPGHTDRYVGYRVGHADQRAAVATLPAAGMCLRDIMRAVVAALPAGQWQAIVFPDRVILYKETQTYTYARETIR
jgi:hypothetical protein